MPKEKQSISATRLKQLWTITAYKQLLVKAATYNFVLNNPLIIFLIHRLVCKMSEKCNHNFPFVQRTVQYPKIFHSQSYKKRRAATRLGTANVWHLVINKWLKWIIELLSVTVDVNIHVEWLPQVIMCCWRTTCALIKPYLHKYNKKCFCLLPRY